VGQYLPGAAARTYDEAAAAYEECTVSNELCLSLRSSYRGTENGEE
jgi:hypothetical protein